MDVSSMTLPQVREAINEKLDRVASIENANGGTLKNVGGTAADELIELGAQLNDLGERRDTLTEADQAAGNIQSFRDYMTKPAAEHPGHIQPNGDVKPPNGVKAMQQREAPKSIGEIFASSDAVKAYKEHGQLDRVVSAPIESVFGSLWKPDATLFQSSGYPIQPQFLPTPIPTLFQANNIGPLFAQGTTTLPTIRYVTETVTAQGAAETAEGGTKPEAQISFTSVDEPVRKIAVTLPLTDEALEDTGFLQDYLNQRLRLFIQMREDLQLLTGNGTPPNLQGILLRSGINTATSYSIGGANPDQALVEAVFHAAMRVRDAFLEPDAAVMRPATWEIAALAKDANRNYLLGGPGAAGYAGNDPFSGPRLWGLRVVLNVNMPAQTATNKDVLVGAFQAGGMIARRSGIDMAISDSHSTFFQENKIMLRAEERLALLVFRPAAFAAVTSAA